MRLHRQLLFIYLDGFQILQSFSIFRFLDWAFLPVNDDYRLFLHLIRLSFRSSIRFPVCWQTRARFSSKCVERAFSEVCPLLAFWLRLLYLTLQSWGQWHQTLKNETRTLASVCTSFLWQEVWTNSTYFIYFETLL